MNFLDVEFKSKAKYIIGVDEVGRGCFMGPMVVGFCFFDPRLADIKQLNDSKQLTDKKRREIAPQVAQVTRFLMVRIPAELIDLHGLNLGYLFACKQFAEYFEIKFDECEFMLDYGIKTPKEFVSQQFKKGDSKCYSIAAASVLAKVYRDSYMENLELILPEFKPASHKGYGTAAHRAILSQIKPCYEHRLSFIKS